MLHILQRIRYRSLQDKVEALNEENVFNDDFFVNNKFKNIELKNSPDVKIINYSWDLIDYLMHGGLEEDFIYFLKQRKSSKMSEAKIISLITEEFLPERMCNYLSILYWMHRDGIIVIDDDSVIEPFTFIKGPAYIGKNCLIKSGTRIYGPCVIGEHSKVAGEIARSLFHSSVNKQHDGFVGNSYVCPFVNLGADTVTSNLKNTYQNIKTKLNGKEMDTGMQFLGSIIGDHSKTSINTMLNTGSIIGIFANIFGGGFPSKDIASFSWNEAGKKSEKYDIDKAIETAKIVMERREIKMSEEYEILVRSYF